VSVSPDFLRSVANLDARAGEPCGRALRDAANEIERLRDELRARRDAAAIEHKIIDEERARVEYWYEHLQAERSVADDLAAVLDAYHERYMDHGPALEEQADAVLARYREARR
jgi:hypothetical protein